MYTLFIHDDNYYLVSQNNKMFPEYAMTYAVAIQNKTKKQIFEYLDNLEVENEILHIIN